ncbi:MAG: prenyltransferase/squalene oxidase repeat-containing protein [Pirellulales bacterium]
MRRVCVHFALTSALVVALAGGSALCAQDSAAAKSTIDPATYEAAVSKAIEFLRASQGADGSFSGKAGPGFTAVVATSILRHGRGGDDPLLAKSLQNLAGFVQADGGIYAPDSRIKTYETSLGLMCFAAANRDGKYDKIIAGAQQFLKGGQYGATDDTSESNVNYGGAGYGGNTRPDLSNTAFLLDALQSAGAKSDDEAVQRALVFVSRCQNLETEHNTTPFAAQINDGGFFYSPAGEGASPAGKSDNGGLRSYGSMTYAGLKSMVYAGLKPDDPRVKAALDWLAKHYTLDENPGLGQAGLYYYYNLMANALQAVDQPTFKDASGAMHDWRQEMTAALLARQRPNGSWVNDDRRWMEGDPNLSTAFALLALAHAQPVK